jgi:plastocyanin
VRRALIAAAAAAMALATATPARAESIFVFTQSQSFSPGHLDVLTGDNVVWKNTSQKTHNVKFDTEGFNSGRLEPLDAANHVFASTGSFPYVCTIHDGMTGEVGVYPLLLSGPRRTVQRGASVALHVRALVGTGEVTIEADSGSGYAPVAVAGPPDGGGHEGHIEPGTLHANVVASQSASYRAVSAAGSSQELRVEVSDGPALSVSARRRSAGVLIGVKASPASPGANVVLELRLRERFGWWPVARARLDKRSRAAFTVTRYGGVPARVVMVGPDWASPLSQSRAFRLSRRTPR